MRAVTISGFGGPEVLHVGTVDRPVARPDDLLVEVHAAGLNRADVNQRRGQYGTQSFGDSDTMGLELAGEVIEVGCNVDPAMIGRRVMGIVGGGAFAEVARLDQGLAIPIPDDMDYIEAAAIPEAFITANQTVFNLGKLQANQSVLIHAGASGVGSAAIQMARYLGARVLATAGSAEKLARMRDMGADYCINYRESDFAAAVMEATGGSGVDLVEDFIGAAYFAQNLSVLKSGGRLVLVALMGGRRSEIPLDVVLFKRLQIIGSVMKSRTLEEKRRLTGSFVSRWLPIMTRGVIRPIIDSVVPLAEVRAAHQRMEENLNIGKIVISIN